MAARWLPCCPEFASTWRGLGLRTGGRVEGGCARPDLPRRTLQETGDRPRTDTRVSATGRRSRLAWHGLCHGTQDHRHLLANGGELVLVEFKTGPQNPDSRECLAQLLDYGSDLWGMTLEDFDTRVARKYFSGPHFDQDETPPPSSLEAAATKVCGGGQADAVDRRERLQSQLRDGGFHYIAVAQRFTRPVLRTVEYLNATMKTARWSRSPRGGPDEPPSSRPAGAGCPRTPNLERSPLRGAVP